MSVVQELNGREIQDVISSAAAKKVPVTLTIRKDNHWVSFQSRLIGLDAARLRLELPMSPTGPVHDFQAGEKVGVSLKLKHHKYVFLAVVDRELAPSAAAGIAESALLLKGPARMQRLQRRAYVRAAVPQAHIIRASFWLGGRQAEPSGTSPDRPVWCGRVDNLSAGGFQLRTSLECVRLVEIGYEVGVRVSLGTGQEAVFADARVRHIALEDEQAVMGFQFLGLEQTDEGKQALGAIGQKVSHFQQASPPPQQREGRQAQPQMQEDF